MKKNNKTIQHVVIVIVVISLIVIVGMLAGSNFDFVNFVMKLHGG
jgi:hypothetical protein